MSRPEDTRGEREVLAERLRAFVLGRVAAVPGSRVALVGTDVLLAGALAEAGCEVVEVPGPRGPLPTHVVLAEEPASSSLESSLGAWVEAAPGAELLLGFRNAGASSSLLATFLEGRPARPGPAEAGMARRLAACGLRVVAREAHALSRDTGPRPPEAGRSLETLFAQLRPDAEDDVVLYALTREADSNAGTGATPVLGADFGRGATEPAAPLTPELLSVIVWADPAHREALDAALFSLACQDQRPLEVVVAVPVTEAPTPESLSVEASLATYRRLEDFSFQVVRGPPGALLDTAIRTARGQYLAFLDVSGLVYPRHFVNLIAALKAGDAAWAVSRAYREGRRADDVDGYVETKVPFPLGDSLELEHLRQFPWLLNVLVLDRQRLAGVSLHVPDPGTGSPAVLLLRLASVLEPVFLNGLPTCEQRGPEPDAPGEAVAELRMVRPLRELEAAVHRAREAGQSAKDLRHRVLDTLNARLKQWVPGLHGTLRTSVRRWLR